MGETQDSWPAGATFIFDINIANEAAAGAGAIELIYTAGEGNEFEILYGSTQNNDTVARTCNVLIDTGTSDVNLALLESSSAGAGADIGWPKSPAVGSSYVGPARFIVSGPCRLRMQVTAVADGQDATFRGALRLKGQAPTRSTVGQGTEVVTVTQERVV